MGFLDKMFGGGTNLTLKLDTNMIPEGGTLAGKVTLSGGKKPLKLTSLKVRLVYVKARLEGPAGPYLQAHMVLAYYPTPNAEPLVLDNLVPEIRPASQRKDLQPVFSFNSEAIWSGVAGNAAKGAGGTGQLSRWQDLLQRARGEGYD